MSIRTLTRTTLPYPHTHKRSHTHPHAHTLPDTAHKISRTEALQFGWSEGDEVYVWEVVEGRIKVEKGTIVGPVAYPQAADISGQFSAEQFYEVGFLSGTFQYPESRIYCARNEAKQAGMNEARGSESDDADSSSSSDTSDHE